MGKRKAKAQALTDYEIIITPFINAKKKLLVLDYDGTLVAIRDRPDQATPPPRLFVLLNALSNQQGTDLLLASGRDQAFMDRWFGQLGLNLIAEHGMCFKQDRGPWSNLGKPALWKPEVAAQLQLLVTQFPLSHGEVKTSSVAWHYRGLTADESRQAKQVYWPGIRNIISNKQLNVRIGKKVIEIVQAGIDKGSAVNQLFTIANYDFILAIGDDRTDELLFRALPPTALTIKVGKGITHARYALDDDAAVRSLLDQLAFKVPPKRS